MKRLISTFAIVLMAVSVMSCKSSPEEQFVKEFESACKKGDPIKYSQYTSKLDDLEEDIFTTEQLERLINADYIYKANIINLDFDDILNKTGIKDLIKQLKDSYANGTVAAIDAVEEMIEKKCALIAVTVPQFAEEATELVTDYLDDLEVIYGERMIDIQPYVKKYDIEKLLLQYESACKMDNDSQMDFIEDRLDDIVDNLSDINELASDILEMYIANKIDNIESKYYDSAIDAVDINSITLDNGSRNEMSRPVSTSGNSYAEIPYSVTSSRKLTDSDLYGLSSGALRLIRNEIYARHGFIFNSEDLKQYFSQFSWYYPQSRDVTSSLSAVEQYNIQFIKSYE